jgi:hypothetical protein
MASNLALISHISLSIALFSMGGSARLLGGIVLMYLIPLMISGYFSLSFSYKNQLCGSDTTLDATPTPSWGFCDLLILDIQTPRIN